MNSSSNLFKRAAALVVATALVFTGLPSAPAQAVARTLTWSNAGTFPLAASSGILNLKFDNNVFLAVASNGDVFNSSNGLSWSKVGSLNGQASTPTVPNAGYKTDLAFGLSGSPVGGDSGVAGTPTWVFTGKDNGTVWTSTDNGANWSVTLTNAGYLKKVAYGDGHFLLGGQSVFKTSTNGINWRDAGNASIAGDSNGKITFGDHTFVIPITYSNKVCRRSTLNWVNDSAFDCTAIFPGAPTDGQAGNYYTAAAYGNGIFVSGLNGGSGKDFWASSDAGATWTRVYSATTNPVNVTFGGGVFVMDKSGGTTAFSADGLTWTETGSRPGGGSGLITYGNGRFIGLGGSNGEVISSGSLTTVAPSTPSGLAAVPGNALANLSWNASADDGGASASYTVTSTPGSFTCTTTSTSCQITGLTNGMSYTFSVTASNSAGSSAASAASSSVTPFVPVPGSPAGLSGTSGNASVALTWTAPANSGGTTLTYTVTSTPGSLTCTTTSTSCQITGLTNGTSYTFSATATNAGGTSAASVATAQLTPAVPVASVSAGSAPNSQLATIPAGVTTAAIPATAELPAISLNFAASSSSATASVAPISNPVAASATPFTVSSGTKIVDIQVTGVSGPVTVCLDGSATDQIFHYTGGAWVELPDRTYANGQVCGVTSSFSPFASATPLSTFVLYGGPQISTRLPRTVNPEGGEPITLTGQKLAGFSSITLDGKPVTILSKTDSQIVIKAPAHAAGRVDLLLQGDAGSMSFQNAFEYKAPSIVRVPVTTAKSVTISSVSAKSLNAIERSAIGAFVASATNSGVLTCSATYTSSSDFSTAKTLASAACAAAKKANPSLNTRVSAPVLVKSKQARKVLLSLTN